ncbi:hypothetical protein HanRHA438_Chr09g0399521 [Helianthus annuus]|nr:hypothetical protein HanIR_Chr09g0418351 [Helianthus annuus]KAJ0888216.1 hypothetical protein HanRHA438_Chr09g0399521 [Helianthus annuus]
MLDVKKKKECEFLGCGTLMICIPIFLEKGSLFLGTWGLRLGGKFPSNLLRHFLKYIYHTQPCT